MIALVLAAGAAAALIAIVDLPHRKPTRSSGDGLRSSAEQRLVPLAIAVVIGMTVSPLLAVVAVVGYVVWKPARTRLERRRCVAKQEAAWPDGLETIALAMSSGMDATEMMRFCAAVGPTVLRPIFALVQDAIDAGWARRDALQLLATLGGGPVAPAVEVLLAADRDGAPMALVLDRLASEAGRAHRLAAEARSRRAPVLMLAPLTLCCLPAVIVGTVVPFVLITLDQSSL